jgi:acyl carrier protein
MPLLHSAEDRNGDRITADPEVGRARLFRTIASVLDVEPDTLSDASSPDTVETWDSLNHLNIAMAIETEFGVALKAEDIMTMRDVALICAALRQHGVDL